MTSCDGCASECAGNFSCYFAATTYGGYGGTGCERNCYGFSTAGDDANGVCNGDACSNTCNIWSCRSFCGESARCSGCTGTCVNSCAGCGGGCGLNTGSSCSADARLDLN